MDIDMDNLDAFNKLNNMSLNYETTVKKIFNTI